MCPDGTGLRRVLWALFFFFLICHSPPPPPFSVAFPFIQDLIGVVATADEHAAATMAYMGTLSTLAAAGFSGGTEAAEGRLAIYTDGLASGAMGGNDGRTAVLSLGAFFTGGVLVPNGGSPPEFLSASVLDDHVTLHAEEFKVRVWVVCAACVPGVCRVCARCMCVCACAGCVCVCVCVVRVDRSLSALTVHFTSNGCNLQVFINHLRSVVVSPDDLPLARTAALVIALWRC